MILAVTLMVDIFYSKVLIKYPKKLLITLAFSFSIFFFLILTGINFNLWSYSGEGILGVYFLNIPVEEYLFMVVAPYGAIVLWEAFHKGLNRK